MQAMCGGHHGISLLAREHSCTRRVSLRYRYGYRLGTGENLERKEQFQALHTNMNEPSVFQDIARYRVW